MRILFVQLSGYLPRLVTGANVSLDALCRRLLARGAEPAVLAGSDPEGGTGSAAADHPYAVTRAADTLAALPDALRRFAPAAVVVRAPEPAERLVGSADAIGRPLHVYFESAFFRRAFPSPRRDPRVRYAANSPFLARMGAAMLDAEVAMIPPVIEAERYRCTQAGDAVLFVNPVAIKGVHVAAAIAARLPHRKFLFVRTWPESADFPHVEPRLPNIEWVPTASDMRGLFARAKLLLMPSVWEESSGRTLGEAQVSGIPAIASDRGGLCESVGPGGVVVSLADPIERWCEAVERVFADPAHFAALAEGARAHAARPDYQPAAVVERFLAFVSS